MHQEDDADKLLHQDELIWHSRVSELITLGARGKVFFLIEVRAHIVLQTLEICVFVNTHVWLFLTRDIIVRL